MAKKKIFDIIPPHLIHCKKSSAVKGKKKENCKISGLFYICLIAVVVVSVLYFSLGSLSVTVWPATQTLSFQETMTLSLDGEIPSFFIEEEKELSQQFLSTGSGSNEGLAQGKITIYNKYQPYQPITLKSGTHFLSDSGKYFTIKTKAVIPAATGSSKPGSVTVNVLAAESGEEYNIDASNFSVPKLAGTDLYYSIYAKSTSKMTGGFESSVKVATQTDIDEAEEFLTKQAIRDLSDSLKSKLVGQGFVLVEGALDNTILEAFSSAKAGSEIPNFDYTVKVKAKALVFKRSDLERFAREYIFSHDQPDRALVDGSLALGYNLKSLDSSSGEITFELDISGKTYPAINQNELSLQLRKRNYAETEEKIYSAFSEQVSDLEIKFWPFWVKKSPNNQKKIHLELKFN